MKLGSTEKKLRFMGRDWKDASKKVLYPLVAVFCSDMLIVIGGKATAISRNDSTYFAKTVTS